MAEYIPHSRRSGANLAFGKDEEEKQIELLRSKGIKIDVADKRTDTINKVDYWIYSTTGKRLGVDAKALSPKWKQYCISCTTDLKLSPDVIYFSFHINNCIYFVRAREIESRLNAGQWKTNISKETKTNGQPLGNLFFYISPAEVKAIAYKKVIV